MKALKLTDDQLEDICLEGSERFDLVNSGEWTQDCKCQSCTFTFKDTTTGLMYQGSIGRSGSPFTDWTYDSEIYNNKHLLKPVEKVEVKTIIFKEVDDSKITETEEVENL